MINRDTYRTHVAKIRAYIEEEGLCNEIGSIIDALEIENSLLVEEDKGLPIYQNRDYAIQVLNAVQKALDLNYENDDHLDRTINLGLLIEDLGEIIT